MFTATATRFLSKTWRTIARCPTKGGEKLVSRAVSIFVRKNYLAPATTPQNRMTPILRLRNRYMRLTRAERAPYEKQAAANAARVAEREKVFKDASASAFRVFSTENFKRYYRAAEGSPSTRMTSAVKAMGEKWKTMRNATKEPYFTAARKIRLDAIPKRDKMIEVYYKNCPKPHK